MKMADTFLVLCGILPSTSAFVVPPGATHMKADGATSRRAFASSLLTGAAVMGGAAGAFAAAPGGLGRDMTGDEKEQTAELKDLVNEEGRKSGDTKSTTPNPKPASLDTQGSDASYAEKKQKAMLACDDPETLERVYKNARRSGKQRCNADVMRGDFSMLDKKKTTGKTEKTGVFNVPRS